MSEALLVAVPNLSEGRDEGRIGGLVRAVGGALLDRHSDASHHRTVLTLGGAADEIGEAAVRLFRAALAELDLRGRRGEHPRVGVLDVLPFVPVEGTPMAEAARAARRVGAEIAGIPEGGIPVFLYGEASGRRVELPEIRRGGTEGLGARLAHGETVPDYGPRRLHPTAGAVAVGARGPLLAFNVDLDTDRVEAARRIASRVRESAPGGLPAVRAIGVRRRDPETGAERAQVSMNLLDFRVTPLRAAFERVRDEARKIGAEVAGSEIVGLPPEAALPPGVEDDLRLPARPRTLEAALREAGLRA